MWAKNFNSHVTEEASSMASKHMKRYSVSLIIMEMQTKTIMRYNYISIWMAKIK